MQTTLRQANLPQPGSSITQQPFGGGAWTGSPWLLAAATMSTVVLIAFSIWQRTEINHLRDAVGQLKEQATTAQVAPASPDATRPTVAKADSPRFGEQATKAAPTPESSAASGQKQEASGLRDTVYVNRYVAVPTVPRLAPTKEQSGQRMALPPQQPDALTSRSSASTEPVRSQTNQINNSQTNTYGVTSTPLTSAPNSDDPSATVKSGNSSVAATKSTNESVPVSNPVNSSVAQQWSNYPAGTNQVSGQSAARPTDKNPEVAIEQNRPVTDKPDAIAGQPADSRNVLTTNELASRPVSTNSINWNALVAQRAKRMRTLRPSVAPTVAEGKKAPASQPAERIVARNRVGLGSDFDAHTWSAGVYTELMLNKHWALGLGLSRATYLGGLFITADDFDNHTHRDFKQEFGRGLDPKLDPKGDILNVDTRMVRLQVPLLLTYRVPLSRNLTLLPSVGTYLNLSSTEKITFYYRQLQRGFDQANLSASRPVDLLNTLSLSAGLEWQSRHWVLQGSPILTMPSQSDLGWQKGTTLGLRARLLYQF